MSEADLTTTQRAAIAEVGDAARAFIRLLHKIGGTDPDLGRMRSANLTLAMRHVEDAESRVWRHLSNARD